MYDFSYIFSIHVCVFKENLFTKHTFHMNMLFTISKQLLQLKIPLCNVELFFQRRDEGTDVRLVSLRQERL